MSCRAFVQKQSTATEMIPARKETDAHAQNCVAKYELLLPSLKVSILQALWRHLSVAPTNSSPVTLLHSSLSRTAPDTTLPLHSSRRFQGPHRLHLQDQAVYPPKDTASHPIARLQQHLPQGHSASGRIMSMKNSNDAIGNRTRDLAACSAVPEPTAPPGAPQTSLRSVKISTSNPPNQLSSCGYYKQPLHLCTLSIYRLSVKSVCTWATVLEKVIVYT